MNIKTKQNGPVQKSEDDDPNNINKSNVQK